MTAWYSSLYTGLFTRFSALSPRAHDPATAQYSGTVAPRQPHGESFTASGIGWSEEDAEAACVGEAIERLQPAPLPDDQLFDAGYADWPLEEPAIPPQRWVLFHPEQYRQAGFPFEPFTSSTVCSWVCCRDVRTGKPWWVPADMVYLEPRADRRHRLAPAVSTGLACGRGGQPVVLRGLQEVIERDAVVGAWWGRYPVEECDLTEVLSRLEPVHRVRLLRPNLTYRCFRIDTPFCASVTLVTLQGEDREGYCFSVGSACRETSVASWRKAILEAVQGRHYVRYLKAEIAAGRMTAPVVPANFAEHAIWYSLHPDLLGHSVLSRPARRFGRAHSDLTERGAELRERLGSEHPVLVRHLTPPAIVAERLDWHVVRVLVPGLQPLHGHHSFAHLGGRLWAPRGLAEWERQLPHPFP